MAKNRSWSHEQSTFSKAMEMSTLLTKDNLCDTSQHPVQIYFSDPFVSSSDFTSFETGLMIFLGHFSWKL